MTTYEKIVKGGTKLKLAAPKAKYIEPILIVTHSARDIHDEDFRVIMKTLATRIQDSAWTVSFKSFLIIHIMIREGEGDLTLQYLSQHIKMLDPKNAPKSSVSMTGFDVKALKTYSKYIAVKAKEYGLTNVDYVRDERLHNAASKNPEGGGRLRRLSVDKGVLREVESVQRQIDALLRCRYQESEVNNDVILTAFRMLVHDLLSLYQSLNEGVINLLEHYFEMSKFDAERSLEIYKIFVDQTKDVVAYLRIAKRLEYATKLHVPTIKHAPTALANSLEEYLHDPNFEMNRRQYLAEKEGKEKTGSSANLVRDEKPKASQVAQASVPNQVQPIQQSQVQQFTQTQPQPQAIMQQQQAIMQQQSGFNPWGFSNQGSAITPQQAAVSGIFQNQVQPQQPQFTVQPAQSQPQQSQFTVQPAQAQLQQSQFTIQPAQALQQQQTALPTQQTSTNGAVASQTNGFTNGFSGYNQAPVQNTQTGTTPNFIPIQKTGVTVQQGNLVPLQSSSTGYQPATQQLNEQSTGFFSQRPNSMITPSFTGAGFGGYGSQSLQQQTTGNPFATNSSQNGFNTGVPTSSSIPQQPLQPQYTSSQTTLKKSETNPFSLDKISESATEPQAKPVDPVANPFSSGGNVQKSKTISLQAMHTGTNPFRVESFTTGQQPLRPQVTAGGLERLPTVPVFPETQRDFKDQQAQAKAAYELEQQKLLLQQQQANQQFQQTGFQPQQIQQQLTGFQPQQIQQQMTGFQPQQIQQQATGFQQQQQQQQQQQFRPQSFQAPQQTGFSNSFQQQTATGNPFLGQTQQPTATGNPFMAGQPQQVTSSYGGGGPSLI